MRSEARRSISAFIRELPEDMRAAVVLRDIQGMSYEDIAVALNTNVGTVKSRISRGRKQLRNFLLKSGNFSPPGSSKHTGKEG